MEDLGPISPVSGQSPVAATAGGDPFFDGLTPDQRDQFEAAIAQGSLSVFTTLIWNQKDSKLTVSPEGDVEYNP